MKNDFNTRLKQEHIIKLREMQTQLPEFLKAFFRGISETTAIRTQLAYAYDLKLFFKYVLAHKACDVDSVDKLEISILDEITPEDIEAYMEYLSYYVYEENGRVEDRQNGGHGKSRKLSAVRTMYSYFCKKRRIDSNPSELVDSPKIHQKNIIRLDVNEVAILLDEIDSGDKLTSRQKKYHALIRCRDLAIVTLLLGTGMRVSECVGIDINDIDFDTNGVRITRKGGNESVVYFGDEVNTALCEYLDERKKIDTVEGHENAFFLSLQRRRITDRSVQKLVNKYAKLATPVKTITPHKLRSTFGTNLYNESRDIYLVADALGHTDVNTTKKHYAQMEDSRRREVVKYIRLRED